jgi:dUTP pyrophosphatase
MKIVGFKKLHESAVTPERKTLGAAGFDMYAIEDYMLLPGRRALIKTGIAMAIPVGFVGLIWPRSGLATKGIDVLAGVVDSDYRGEVMINLINHGDSELHIAAGERVAQIIFQEHLRHSTELREIDSTERGENGFGSTGFK